ncbi:PQQ-binding-like beta-propeller repeat protein [Phytoactinopolyspora mesophila]|uniref:outer membrane protein assembly factor BamB family protein n=1 Tax=Phytoactinopolyspora mesophila TaxID=2650750 RepID=UPI0013907CEA|nr:PQQ-binding-like beta-propeller repeat protein [Phytoactinopolyspora mesophila]
MSNPTSTSPTEAIKTPLSRRTVLVGAGAAALSFAVGARLHAVAGGNEGSFAMLTDVHIDVDRPERTADFERILRHIEPRNPSFVLNCGDMTELGLADEYETYLDSIPDGLRELMRNVPGNHEQQWSVDYELYHEYLGAGHYSFDSGGLHFVSLDPQVMMEWGWYFDEDLLDWLERDLRQVPKNTPIIIFLHYPMGADWNYVHNDDEVLRIIEKYPVRGIFAGHRHSTIASQYNGATQVIGNSLKNGPYYYWVERKDRDSGPVLEITEVTVPADGEVEEERVAVVPLDSPGPGETLGPLRMKADPAGSEVALRVDVPPGATVEDVQARIHPYRYGRDIDRWSSLERADGQAGGRRWTGRIDSSELWPGQHKMEVRAVGDDGALYDDVVRFELPSANAQVRWTTGLDGRIQGALGTRDGVVVAATTKGHVEAYAPTHRANRLIWRAETGPVYRQPVFTPDGSAVLIPSTDHHLYALDAGSGAVQWSTNLDAPLAGDVALAEVDGETRIFVAAGTTLFSLDLSGDILWSADLSGICAGRPECDGERVYIGSGDGNAYAFTADSGDEVWSVQLTDRTTRYGTVLYGPWACYVRILPNGAALFTTFTNAFALDGATGDLVWEGQGDELGMLQLLYTPPTLTDHGILLVDGFNGTIHVVDPDTGEEIWQESALPRNFGAAPVPSPDDDSVYWLVNQSGLLVRIDLENRSVDQVLQVLSAYTQSTAALLGSGSEQVLVVGGQDGVLHGVVGLHDV